MWGRCHFYLGPAVSIWPIGKQRGVSQRVTGLSQAPRTGAEANAWRPAYLNPWMGKYAVLGGRKD